MKDHAAAEPTQGEDWRTGEHRTVAYVDIIGFSDVLKKLDSSPGDLPTVVSALMGGSSTFGSSTDEEDFGSLIASQEGEDRFLVDRQQVFFSDCAIVSARCVPGAPDAVLQVVLDYAQHLLRRRFVLRGGIARGLVVHRGNLVVGPAALRAYLLERDAAHYPRIVVEDAIANEILSINDSPNPIATIRRSEDGLFFVDILTTLGLREGGSDALFNAREVIVSQLEECETLYLQAKWRWLAAQYNRALLCAQTLRSGADKFPDAIDAPEVADLR